MEEVIRLEDENKVLVVTEDLDPNGEPVMFEFTLDEWDTIQDSSD